MLVPVGTDKSPNGCGDPDQHCRAPEVAATLGSPLNARFFEAYLSPGSWYPRSTLGRTSRE